MQDRKENSLASPRIDMPEPNPSDMAAVLAHLPVAIIHDWLVGMRGGEWVLAALLKLLPQAEVHTLFYSPTPLVPSLQSLRIRASLLNHLPGVTHYYRWLLPLLPWTISRSRPNPNCRLVLKTSHCVAHGAPAPKGALQIHYYFSPMRYLYDQAEAYATGGGGLGSRLLRPAAPALRRWDRAAAQQADCVWAISRFVANRIERIYGRKAEVIYPPVRTDVFQPPADPTLPREDEDLVVSALVPYKRVDLAIQAANRLRRPLRIVGTGPLRRELERLAGPTVTFEGHADESRLIKLYQTRRMLVFPGTEDFGIVPLEAMACGLPVLALRGGGLLETLPEGSCGAFFEAPTVEALAGTWEAFNPKEYAHKALRENALQYSEMRFLEIFGRRLQQTLQE
jgi:glycosyltransferase involved in cell wall biosynthesis